MENNDIIKQLQKDVEFLKSEYNLYLNLQNRVNRVFFDADKHITDLYSMFFERYFTLYVAGAFVKKELDKYILSINGFKIYLPTDIDLVGGVIFGIITEIFIQKNYDRFDDSKDFVFVDCGSNVMLTSLYMANKPTCKAVYSFELLKETYEQGLVNIDLNNASDKITSYNIGLSDKDEIVVGNFNKKNKGLSTINKDLIEAREELFQKNSDFNELYKVETPEKINLEVKKAYDVISPIVSKHEGTNLVLKIDTEGCEVPILNSLLDEKILNKFSVILLEYHSENDKIYIIKMLEDNGYKVSWIDDIGLLFEGNLVAIK